MLRVLKDLKYPEVSIDMTLKECTASLGRKDMNVQNNKRATQGAGPSYHSRAETKLLAAECPEAGRARVSKRGSFTGAEREGGRQSGHDCPNFFKSQHTEKEILAWHAGIN